MVNKDTLVKVTNRSNSIVGYSLPEMHITRRFRAGESKELLAGELRALAWTKGGRVILEDHLVMDNEDLVNELVYNVQPEYFYTKDDVKELLLMGSEDQLLDALDFGGDGIKSLIKDLAVELQLNDVRKRDIIKEKTGFDVTKAIEFKMYDVVDPSAAARTRRSAPITNAHPTEAFEDAPQRRTAPKYTVKVKAE